MPFLYLYDIKAKNKRDFNRVKRVFYYHLNKLDMKKIQMISKSVMFVPEGLEQQVDKFFKRFGKAVVVYKAHCDKIEQL